MPMRRIGLILVAVAALAPSSGTRADQGCEDMKTLCKEATARAAKCVKEQGGEAQCKQLIDVRDATCTHADIVCKPAVKEPD